MINVFETGDEVTDEESLMRVMSATLRFPEEFGRNWDAMVDGLRGVDCNGARRGLVLLLHHARRLWNGAPEVAGQLVEVWLSVAEERRAHDEPFHLVFVW
jgi:RNAse (barnase) inhibitor barstar